MGRVRQKDTAAELLVRKAAHALGLRFRLHRRDLPGHPDLAFPRYRVALFVHGCFWHRHAGCLRCTLPKNNADYWQRKFRENQARDSRVEAELLRIGWTPTVIWECEALGSDTLGQRLCTIFALGASGAHVGKSNR